MQRNRLLYIGCVVLAVVVLAGLLLLASNLDKLNPSNAPTVPSSDPSGPSLPSGGAWDTTYAEYLAMTQAEKDAHYYRFESGADFFLWLEAAKEEYDANKNEIQIGPGGNIDIGDIVNGNR